MGPGLLVTAAFIGPGTVVTASSAGAQFGLQLLWAVAFSCVAAILLQSQASRLGILSGRGLGESIREILRDSRWRWPAIALVVVALGVGNGAYQTGNLTGAAIGLQAVVGGWVPGWILTIATIAAGILWAGNFRWLQRIMIMLVAVLSVSFVLATIFSIPKIVEFSLADCMPQLTSESLTLTVALIGTTLVPYNLFLHCSSSAKAWGAAPTDIAIRNSNWDTRLSITLGGVVTAAIVVTSAIAFHQNQLALGATSDIAKALRPVLGEFSGAAFALGLFAAGLTSSITAPLATAFALSGVVGWPTDVKSLRFRAIALVVVLAGAAMAIGFGKSPAQTIVLAQVTNGLLLPVTAVFLVVVVRRLCSEGEYRLGTLTQVLSWAAIGIAIALGSWRIYSAIA